MKYLFYLGHPSHFHVHKYTISRLKKEHDVYILIKKKDVLEDLVKKTGWKYTNILPEGRGDNKVGIFIGLIKRTIRMLRFCYKYRPDILIGTSAEITYVGKILGVHAIVVNEDDVSVVPLFAKLAYPLASAILSPRSCNLGKWEDKGSKYPGYQKLTYLHPTHFSPDENVVKSLYGNSEKYFLLRFSKLGAHHDFGIDGITNIMAVQLIDILKQYGSVWISSERDLPSELEDFRLTVDVDKIHHVIYFANLFISDSQSMTVEAAILGTPSIRYSDFVGEISVLEELEHKYHLTIGIKPTNLDELFETIKRLTNQNELIEEWQSRREIMLSDVIDVSIFFLWYLTNYPRSAKIIRDEPDYIWEFKTT